MAGQGWHQPAGDRLHRPDRLPVGPRRVAVVGPGTRRGGARQRRRLTVDVGVPGGSSAARDLDNFSGSDAPAPPMTETAAFLACRYDVTRARILSRCPRQAAGSRIAA